MYQLETRDLILINSYAQGIVDYKEVLCWFEGFSESDRQNVVKEMWRLAIQSNVIENDLYIAIQKSRVKETASSISMMKSQKRPFHMRGYETSNLNGKNLLYSFRLMLEIFVVADLRRRSTECLNGCSHWWHRDLANDEVIQKIFDEE